MKKRLLAMLLAMLMVMGTLPMTVFAAGETATDTVTDIADKGVYAMSGDQKVVLANYTLPGTAPWKHAELKITNVDSSTVADATVVSLTLSVIGLTQHANSKGDQGKWIGIGVPANSNNDAKDENAPAYYTALGDYAANDDTSYTTVGYAVQANAETNTPAKNGYVADGYLGSQKVTVAGTTYANRYWDIKDVNSGDKGFVVKRTPKTGNSGYTYVIYDVTFNVSDGLGEATAAAGTETGTTSKDANGVHTYTATAGTVELSLEKSGNDGAHTGNIYGYYTKMTMPEIPAGCYVILSRSDNNGDTALTNALSGNHTTYPYDVNADKGLAQWMEVYDKAAWDSANTPYWTEISRQPIVNVTVALKAGDSYTFEKYKFDFSNVKLALPFTVSGAETGDLTGFCTNVTDFQDDVNVSAAAVPAKLTERNITVTGTSKWFDCPAFGTDRTAANYVALKLAAKTGVTISKIKVTMSDGTTTKEFPATDALLWQFNGNATNPNNKISIRVYFGTDMDHGSVAYVLDCSGMTLTPATVATPTVVVAPIVDHGDPAKTDLGTVTVTQPVAVEGQTNTYSLTLTGENIAYHENAQNAEGTWVGFGMPVDDESATGYTYTVNGTAVGTIQGRVYTVGTGEAAKHYNTVYFSKAGDYTVVQTKAGVSITYKVKVEITVAAGTAYTAGALAPANLTGWIAEPYTPAGTHATEYKVENENKTITITAKGLEKTTNTSDTTAYWVGVALPKQDGCTYAKGFGDKPATGVTYGTLTTEQTVVGKSGTFVTTYWGFSSAEKIAQNTKGWLSVKDANGKVVDYVVNFDITLPEAAAYVDGDVKAANLTAVDGKPAPAFGHADTYTVDYVPADREITINATGLEKTTNTEGQTYYWVGLALKETAGHTYAYGFGDYADADAADKTDFAASGSSQIENGATYNTIYWGFGNSLAANGNRTGWLSVKDSEGKVITYTVNFVITVAEGNAYDEDSLVPANLTYAEGEDAPEYGHVGTYEVDYVKETKTITITANGLEKTENSNGDVAYWVGVGVPQTVVGAKYAWYFKGDATANKAYREITRTQETDGVTYTTLYWGWEDAEELATYKEAVLSVMDANGKVVDYTVKFEITVPITVTTTPDESGNVVVDDEVIADLINAAAAGKDDPSIIEGDVPSTPVATINVTDIEDLTTVSVDVSAGTLKDASDNGVSVALEVEGLGSMTLSPSAIDTATNGQSDSSTLTLEVAKVDDASSLGEDLKDGRDKAEALASFTASVLDENGDAVTVIGGVTLVFETDIPADKTARDIDVYQDGDKLTTGVTLLEGTLTLKVSHLSEFVVMTKDEKQDPPTPPYTPSVPTNTTYAVENGSGSADNGSWSTDKTSAAEGDTVTITVTPAEGYRVIVTVKDAQGKNVTVTKAEDGKYTFTMPKSKVDVSVSFAKLIVFTDVKDDAYYADAVAWAVANGITNGVGNDKFAPKLGCTRADIVTFLWRAMGSPEVDTTVEFTDVEAGSYYEKAVAWAVANGITNGIGDGKFAPKQVCTRAQIVTFLWRTAKSPEVSDSESGFNDVRADAYYADAVAWAVANEITNGTGNNNFSPKSPCTRADIVTFLYRYMA